MGRKRRAWRLGAFVALAALATAAPAQTYPTKPIRLVVPYPAGGTTDLVTRIVSPPLAEALGQPIVVENKAGAGGTIGTAEVARATPDGHTALVVFDNHGVNHHLYKNLPYDPLKAFEPVSLMVQSPLALVGATSFQPASVGELVDYARANRGKVPFGSTGTGNSGHLAALLLAQRGGFDALHVPYKGGAPLINDLLGGQVSYAFISMPLVAPHIKGGKLKGLGIAGKERAPQLPQVPTVAETLPGFEAQSWVGILVPAGTPQPVIARLAGEVTKILARPDMKERLAGQGFIVVGSSPADFGAYIRAESDKWGKVIRELNVTLE
ncbi:MAG TPA: tripartite tricarboxylate transporter substrate binding protein [Burkholderiales bacterium]|nr:tripartite tricarboxylate transporter substrate binding protein [Burkholderiales bacterium]